MQRSDYVVSLVSILALIAHLGAALTGSNWTWGFNHYYFMPRWLTLLLIGLGCALCLPWSVSAVVAVAERARFRSHRGVQSQSPSAPAFSPAWVNILVALLVAALFWLLRTPHHFLGDGRLLIRLLNQGSWFHAHEPLDHMIHYGLLELARTWPGWSAEGVYAALSVAGGFVYALAALRLGDLFGHRTFITAFLLTLGTVVLFMGYAESYSLATAAILLYMLLALEHLGGKRRAVWAGIVLLIGMALHHALVFLVPSFLIVIASGRKPGSRDLKRVIIPGALFVILSLAVYLVTTLGQETVPVSNVLVPLSPDPIAQYTFFSSGHLADFMNQQVLLSPLGWLAALALAIAVLRSGMPVARGRNAFLLTAAVFPLIFNILLRPGLGGSRDWDLWSMGSLPYLIAAACWMSGVMDRRSGFRNIAYTVVLVGLIHIVPWVAINTSAGLSLEHFQHMLRDNTLWTPRRVAAARAELGSYYSDMKAYNKAAGQLEEAVRLAPDIARYRRGLGTYKFHLGRIEEAEAHLKKAIELDPEDATAHSKLGQLYILQHRGNEAEKVLARAVEIDPGLAHAHFSLGVLYQSRREPEKAAEAYRRATDSAPREALYWYHLALVLDALPGNEDEALDAWRRVLRLAGDDPDRRRLSNEAARRLR